MPYLPIESYGVIGNLRTVALVGRNGSIDWFCWTHFDSPSVFGGILDWRKGGHFSISPHHDVEGVNHKQLYWPDTNVLLTRFLSADGVGEILDYTEVLWASGEKFREINGLGGIRVRSTAYKCGIRGEV